MHSLGQLLEDVEKFVKGSRKGGKYWAIYRGQFAQGSNSHRQRLEYWDPERSEGGGDGLGALLECVSRQCRGGAVKNFTVVLRENQKDSTPDIFPFRNPIPLTGGSHNVGGSSFGGYGQLDLLTQHFNQRLEYFERFTTLNSQAVDKLHQQEFKHFKELQERDKRIADLEARVAGMGQSNGLLGALMENDRIGSILEMIAGKMFETPPPPPHYQPQGPIHQHPPQQPIQQQGIPQPQGGEKHTDEQPEIVNPNFALSREQWQHVHNSLVKIHSTLEVDSVELLWQLAEVVENDPALAKMFQAQIQKKIQEYHAKNNGQH